MLTGVIQPRPGTRSLDRSDTRYALWEQNPKPNTADLPWPTAASFDASKVRDLLSSAATVVVGCSHASLLEQVLASLQPRTRAYVYGSQSMESERGFAQLFAKVNDRVAVRLGYELPTDWIVLDGGRTGVLFVGPPGEARRWAISLDPAVARSLFEAFRVLYWFHSRREGLPDRRGTFAFRAPLASPYGDPGKDVQLAAGRLAIDGTLPDLVPDAEFRIIPNGSMLGRTATAVCPPVASAFDAARQLAATGARVVWIDSGLPQATISRQRLVMDLVAAPVAIQLEWGSGTAVDTFHRVTKASEAPKWTFHAQRRLGDIGGLVLLEGASAPAPVRIDERIDLPDVRASLATFDTAEPSDFRPPSPLAKRVHYTWRTVPAVVPAGAGKAPMVRQWIALDEWASASVRTLRQRLETMEGEERSFLDRLRGVLRGQDAVQRERARIRDALVEIGEQPLSQRSVVDAAETARRLMEEDGRIRGLLSEAQTGRQKAEDEADEAMQRQAWQGRVEQATRALAEKRTEVQDLEGKEAEAETSVRVADAMVLEATHQLRAARAAKLAEARDNDTAALAEVRGKLAALDAEHKGAAPKGERRPLTQELQRLDGAVAQLRREIAAVEAWTPPAADLASENARLRQAREKKEALRKARAPIQALIPKFERDALEAFRFRAGARLPPATPPEIGAAPPVPTEASPELGDLFEHQGQRFLAVKTWEQVPRAARVATRLRAELVAFPDSTK